MVNEPEKRVFLALADTARKFEEDRVYAQLREDIDCIKGPLKVHGLCMYLRRLHVTKPSTVGIRLGAGKQRFVVSKYSMQAKKKISGFLKMHSVLDAMPTCSSIQVYQKQKKRYSVQ